jgi:tetraprenyl-beta-curcumene synthase
MRVPLRRRAALAVAFARAARTYWLSLYLWFRKELRRWRCQARAIPDPTLRRTALSAQQAKVGNIEGAVAFATFVDSAHRIAAARAMAAYEAVLDYLDCLCEMPHPDPLVNARQLNRALIAAVDPSTPHRDYYAHHPHHADGGYLCGLLETCRIALRQLPAYPMVAGAVRRISARNAIYQTLNHGDAHGSHRQFERWVKTEAAKYEYAHPGTGLRWWELGAAAGSSLGVFALIAAAADPTTRPSQVARIERVYFPWIGAVNSLLDSFVDQQEDSAPGQHRLLDYYASHDEAVARLEIIITQALRHTASLPSGHHHRMIMAAMVSFYISAPEAPVYDVRERILATMDDLGTYTMLIMRARRSAVFVATPRSRSRLEENAGDSQSDGHLSTDTLAAPR